MKKTFPLLRHIDSRISVKESNVERIPHLCYRNKPSIVDQFHARKNGLIFGWVYSLHFPFRYLMWAGGREEQPGSPLYCVKRGRIVSALFRCLPLTCSFLC